MIVIYFKFDISLLYKDINIKKGGTVLFPTRFFIVNTEGFYFIWKMKVVQVYDTLQIQLSYHEFLTPITKSIVESIISNESNEDYFKTLPLQVRWTQLITLNESERVTVTLSEVLNNYKQTYNYPIQIKFPWITIRMFWTHWYSIYSFTKQFNENYYTFKEKINKYIKKDEVPIIELETVVSRNDHSDSEEDYEIMINVDTLTLTNDCLKMVPNNVIRYFLTKYIDNYIKGMYGEKEYSIGNINSTLIINIAPLLDVQLIGLSKRHYQEILIMINSFNPLPDESFSILNQLINQLLFMINHTSDHQTLHLPLKIIEFLIFIYSIKHYNLDFLSQIPEENSNPLIFHNLMTNMVNHYINHILNSHDLSKKNFNKINFIHCQDAHFEKEIIDIEQLKDIISKEKFMLDIDRQKFITLVQEQTIKENIKEDKRIKLILQNPNLLKIDDFINKENNSSWLNYNIITPPQNLNNHTILTQDYLHLLKLSTSTDITTYLIQQELSVILTRYADIILNRIYSDINAKLDKYSCVSTLTLLQEYIRPNTNNNSTINTDFHILYKCIIPYLYDVYNIREIRDYFH